MLPFPFVCLTWRECVVGLQPTEMIYMQVEKNWVQFNPVNMDPIGNGSARGENMGFVKWRMSEELRDGRRLRMLHTESYELKTGELKIEEDFVDPATNALVFQNEQFTSRRGNLRSECTFFPDRIEVRRTLANGKIVTADMIPAEGMDAVQKRFAPLADDAKDFLVVDGIRGTFHKMRLERSGRFNGNWGADKYDGNAYRFSCDGRTETVMLNEAQEIVKIEFTDKISLALTSQPRSKRYEDNLPGRKIDANTLKTAPLPIPLPVPVKQGTGTGTRR